MTQTEFHDLLAAFRSSGPVAFPETWMQGRTAYGGLTAALCVEAARAEVDDLPALRSLQVNFTGPVTDTPSFAARLLRRGRNVSAMGVEARAGEQSVASAQLVFAAARESQLRADAVAPDCPGWADSEPFVPSGITSSMLKRFVPTFFGNFEVRLAGGSRPASGAQTGRVLAWVRHADPASRTGEARDREAAFVCLGDVLPPAAFSMLSAPAPMSSVNWQLNILRTLDTEEGWFLIETRQTAARDGYSSQHMRYWDSERALVGEGMQLVAVFA